MIPLVMRLKVREKGKKGVNLWIPIILAWILLLLLMILLLPVVLLVGLILWKQGYGKVLLLFYPRFFVLLFSMSGLKIDVESKNSKIFFNFI